MYMSKALVALYMIAHYKQLGIGLRTLSEEHVDEQDPSP